MRQVQGLIDGIDIWREMKKKGNSVYIDLGYSCGVVYYPNVYTLRRIIKHLSNIPHGSDSGGCARCFQFTGNNSMQKNVCEKWISDLLKGEGAMLEIKGFIPLQQPGNLYGVGSYVAKCVPKGETIEREYVRLGEFRYGSKTVCQILIPPAQCGLSVGDYIAVRLLYGKAKSGFYKDDRGDEKKIKEKYYLIDTDPKEVTSFFDCLKPVKYAEVIEHLRKR